MSGLDCNGHDRRGRTGCLETLHQVPKLKLAPHFHLLSTERIQCAARMPHEYSFIPGVSTSTTAATTTTTKTTSFLNPASFVSRGSSDDVGREACGQFGDRRRGSWPAAAV
ncbi:unnamed protein product, partial [Ixodes pacificus]